MRILVTGGAGFIGSHVVDLFIAEGHTVTVIDDLSSGRRENINAKARFYEGSILSLDLERILCHEKIEVVDHLAAQTEPVEFGEGDARAPLADAYKAMLKAQPRIVEFGEQATRERAATPGSAAEDDDAQFAESADPERMAQHKAVRAYMAEHKVDYATAARAVIK